MATSILPWRIPWTAGASGHNLPANAGDIERHRFNPIGKIPWRRAWQPTPVFLPGESMDEEVWQATVHRAAKSWK